MLTAKDQHNLLKAGRSPELVLRQLEQLRLGSSSLMGLSPATIEKGIRLLSPDEQLAAIQVFSSKSDTKRWMNFVPASGAASRMFAPFYRGQEILKN